MSGSSKNCKSAPASWLDQLGNSKRWEKSAKQSALLLISRLCSAPLCAMRSSFQELIAASSTNTMSLRKSFISGQAAKWKKSWSTPIRQPRCVSDKGLLVEQRKRKCQHRLPTSDKSRSLLPEGCDPS